MGSDQHAAELEDPGVSEGLQNACRRRIGGQRAADAQLGGEPLNSGGVTFDIGPFVQKALDDPVERR